MKTTNKSNSHGRIRIPVARRAKVRYSHAGFSLMETTIAIGVILTALAGVLILAGQSTSSVRTADKKMIAAHLAQEGIEVVVGIRDNNWIAEQGWRTNLPTTDKGIVDYNSAVVTVVSNLSNHCLSLTGGVYVQDSPPCTSIFSRHIEIIDRVDTIGVTPVGYIEVISEVSWLERGAVSSINIVDHLYDWR